MRTLASICCFAVLAIGTVACNKVSDQAQTAQADPGNPPPDAANGNLASVDQSAPQAPQQYQQAPAPADYSASAQYSDASDTVDAASAVYAPLPPPELPEYTQPPCPGENYYWTPGYWDYSTSDYYWVPGAWVLAPYVGALWTPPYWAFDSGRYRFYRGYWAPHIGFYGGLNYGFGYTGRGYYGGYWNGGNFVYNRAVNNVNVTIVHNVYNRSVTNFTSTRISYNGGPRGVNVRPIPAEAAVLRERREPPVAAQTQHVREAATNRAQFVSVNHGRPAQVAVTRPLPTEYRAPAARPEAAPVQNRAVQNNVVQNHGEARAPAQGNQPPQRTEARPEARPFQNARPEPQNRPAPEARPQDRGIPAQRSIPEQRPAPAQNRPAPIERPAVAPRPEPAVRPAPVPRPEPAARPAPVARPEPAARPAPPPRPEPPAARPAPAPAPRPAPAARSEEKEKR